MIQSPLLSSLALASVLTAQAPPASMVAPPRPIDLAICLDISGSMDGLLNAARQNLWAVVNEMATLKPAPALRVALLTYGCSAHSADSGWVKLETGFTTDLDLVSQKLFELTTNGGEEYVARVVRGAIDQLEWSPDGKALKLLFVAGNEAATQDPKFTVPSACADAIRQGIVVNSIYCGSLQDEEASGWREVAKLADGRFAAIEQDANVVVVTPFDEQLAALSATINTTYVPYGAEGTVWAENQVRQDSNVAGLNGAAAAQRCQTKASGLYSNGHWDLVDACSDPKFVLADVDKKLLPEALRALGTEELRQYVETQTKKRNELKQQIDKLGQQRDAHVQAELKRRAASGEKVFEQAVLEAVREQAAAKGFERPAPPKAKDCDSPFVPIVKEAVRNYEQFSLVTGAPRVAPEDCRMPAPFARRSTAEKEHGGKLYLLYARHADGLRYVQPGVAAQVGQTLVKQAWTAVAGEPHAATEASRRYLAAPVVRDGETVWHAGDAAGLFVMHKLDARTPDTDQGWVYATIDRDGIVTAAGRVASCIRCHENADEDRRFGLR
ncbi:MAG: cytochrome P460 family protein [Planctomycetes bacterium]|nr:cytochrome P460 family protein [Planctomycetota bacterium]